MLEGAILGIVQGITEWIPVSSEGSVVLTGSLLFGMGVEDALAFALWLHLGTAVAAVIAFRREIAGILREALTDPLHPSPLLRYLVAATLVSGAIGFPLLLTLEGMSETIGGGIMIFVGALMLITGGLQIRQRVVGTRTRKDLGLMDAVIAGVAQGFAAMPGLSRSGLTVAALLGRQLDRAEALAISFLMSIPVSLGAALYFALDSETVRTRGGLVGAAVAALVGIATIKAFIALARRINFGVFVLVVGLLLIAAGVMEITL